MKNDEIVLAQIGCGYWGPNLLRNFSAQRKCWVKYVVETSEERRSYVTNNFPRTKAVADAGTVWNDPEVDGVIIATPAASHHEMAARSLQSSKHTFVEKPLAMNGNEARTLVALAVSAGVKLMVGHTFLYNPAVRYLKSVIASGDLGRIYYVYAQRLNLGVIRSDVNAMWNLAPHDISIIAYLLGGLPHTVSVAGTDYIQPGIHDVVFMSMQFPEKVHAHVHISWLDPNKVRKITVVGSKKMVVYNDVSDDKITIYDKGIDRLESKKDMVFDNPVAQKLVHRTGDIIMPKIDSREPLRVEAEHFLECIRTGTTPMTDGINGVQVVDVLTAAQESLENNGKLVTLIAH